MATDIFKYTSFPDEPAEFSSADDEKDTRIAELEAALAQAQGELAEAKQYFYGGMGEALFEGDTLIQKIQSLSKFYENITDELNAETERYLSALVQVDNLYPNIPVVREIIDALATPQGEGQ